MGRLDLKKYERLLLEKRKVITQQLEIADRTGGNATPKEASGELSSHTYHMADLGTDAMARELSFAQAQKASRLLYHIDNALERINDGTYGRCVSCEKMIPAARLEAIPHARFCIACREKEEEAKAARK